MKKESKTPSTKIDAVQESSTGKTLDLMKELEIFFFCSCEVSLSAKADEKFLSSPQLHPTALSLRASSWKQYVANKTNSLQILS